jgi:Flp pilus assembly protein TadB
MRLSTNAKQCSNTSDAHSDKMKTILAIGAVLVVGGVCLLITEPEAWIAVVLVVVGLSPFTLWTSQNDKF